MVLQVKANDAITGEERFGYYVKLNDKDSSNGSRHLIYENGVPYSVNPDTLKIFTGIFTKQLQPIFEGDTIKVWDDVDSHSGTVAYVRELAGFYLKDTVTGEWCDIVGDVRYFVS